MKLGIHTKPETASASQWLDFDMEGYEENLKDPIERRIRFLIVPQTRTMIAKANKAVEKEKKALGRKDLDAMPESLRGKDYAFTRHIARMLVEDWQGIVDADGSNEPLECNDVNKGWLFENVDIAFWVQTKAQELAAVRIEEEVKNSEG